ncbi:Plant Tudor-like RNA-binding protein [Euphorbia peplus]|nr:Plant Tudor-like RNA-binding protein [Euphorbia peplus]
MRFKKGSSVEVFSKKEVPTGAWLCAEVMSGNGHTYSVKYRNFPNSGETMVERVSRKAIRPCPSAVKGHWIPGDVVEVYHNFSWKMARILEVKDGEMFSVRILGVSKGCFHKSFLRVRQCWQDDKWFVIGKGSEIVNLSSGKSDRTKTREQHVGDDSFYVNTELEMPRVFSAGTLKRRSPLGWYDLEAHPAAAQKKRRLIEKGSSREQMYAVHHSPTSEKVDAVVYPDVILGENHMNSSFNVATAKFSLLDTSSRSDSFVIDCCTVSEDTDSCASSSGSCSSMGNDANNLPFRCSTQHGNNTEDYFSDAESSCEVQFEKVERSHHSGKQSGIEFRRSELDVYRSTIEDLYALGPLSWEDESKLTNLRHSLHISDDQHMMLLRNLISPNRMLLVS